MSSLQEWQKQWELIGKVTRDEVLKILRMNFALYKLGAKPLTDAELQAMVEIWSIHFASYPYETILQAFVAANRVCKYPIQPADIFEQLNANHNAEMAEYWRKLKNAIDCAGYYMTWRGCPMALGVDEHGNLIKSNGAREIQNCFNSLPDIVKQWVGSPSELCNLSKYSEEELDRYRRPEFMKLKPATINQIGAERRLDAKTNARIAGNKQDTKGLIPQCNQAV